ncbi:phage head-tail adaptor, putative, SPP1 family [Singulisphaera sp. GP187]|uniref:phage head closure protein n=1 Tax=Singulisphaera sp. GP187 TaxID=1882752 RepID=UPI000926719F|nr:phage head closure protein [Singulisphaera sp. GP187]SIO60152.1 phage head-tail adaptor, putative, SPP1 family [Singulisphaera sp. GP187]
MKPGTLRKRVTLQSATEAPSTDGQMIPTWADVGTYWASIRTPTGREVFNAAQIHATLTHVLEMRYIGPIEPTQRFTFKSRTYDISWINNVDERNREYVIYVTEVVKAS